MDEFRKILIEAIEVLRKPIRKWPVSGIPDSENFVLIDKLYNKALDDVIEQVIKRIPD